LSSRRFKIHKAQRYDTVGVCDRQRSSGGSVADAPGDRGHSEPDRKYDRTADEDPGGSVETV
ncbi:MAG: hypothetical protein O2992_10860, partial [Gemmatimonadetes bacterium]|nr:hypothetical protein [Gemmatimonadota bacterium]